jgi:hypothetical protein
MQEQAVQELNELDMVMPDMNELFLENTDIELIQDGVIMLDAIRMSAEKV